MTGSFRSPTRMKTPELQPFGELVVEVEDEVAVRLVVDDDVAARAVRVEAVGLDVGLGQGLACAVGDPALRRWTRRRSS